MVLSIQIEQTDRVVQDATKKLQVIVKRTEKMTSAPVDATAYLQDSCDELGVTSDQYGARLKAQGVNDAQKVSSYGEAGDSNQRSPARRGGRVQVRA